MPPTVGVKLTLMDTLSPGGQDQRQARSDQRKSLTRHCGMRNRQGARSGSDKEPRLQFESCLLVRYQR